MPKQTTTRLIQIWLFALPVSALLSVLFFPKRKLLVDATELATYPEYIPWYYVPFHCESMPPWDQISSGSPFCMAVDVRLVVLVPFAIACLLVAGWMKYTK